jgi:hypothetical protein
MRNKKPGRRSIAKPQHTKRWYRTHERALRALAEMRKGVSLANACRQERLKPDTFRRHVGNAVRRNREGGRFFAVSEDTLRRELYVLTDGGYVPLVVTGSKMASLIAEHANAVAHFYRRNDPSKLRKFEGQTFQIGGRNVILMTDPAKLRELEDADAHKLDTLYVGIG